jgi:hypothetical protein
MYANLKVHVGDEPEPLCAWMVGTNDAGEITVHLDDPESESNYAEPVGTRTLPAGTPITVEACF